MTNWLTTWLMNSGLEIKSLKLSNWMQKNVQILLLLTDKSLSIMLKQFQIPKPDSKLSWMMHLWSREWLVKLKQTLLCDGEWHLTSTFQSLLHLRLTTKHCQTLAHRIRLMPIMNSSLSLMMFPKRLHTKIGLKASLKTAVKTFRMASQPRLSWKESTRLKLSRMDFGMICTIFWAWTVKV